jgi:hypothetical protein
MTSHEFEWRIRHLAGHLPPVEEAFAKLRQKLAEMLAELTERLELIGLREERDLARAIGKAKGDAGAETAQRQRVENSMDRQRRMSLKEFRALVSSRPEPGDTGPDDDGDGDGDGTPAEPGPGTEPDASPTPAEPGAEHHYGASTAITVTTAATGSAAVTGPGALLAAPAEAVKTAPADPIAEADTPQKSGSEPICQNGRLEGEAEAPGGAVTLTCPSGTVSQGDGDCGAMPDATGGATGSAIPRPEADSVIPDGGAKDDISDRNRFPGGTGHQ